MFVSFTLPQLAPQSPQPASAWTHSSACRAIACEHAAKWGIGRREKWASRARPGGKKEGREPVQRLVEQQLIKSGGRGFDSHRGRRFFSLPRVVPHFLSRANAQKQSHGST